VPSSAPVAAANSAAAAAPAPQKIQQPTTAAAYTVTLTEAQRVFQLYNQGQRISQIASSLSLSENVVNNYLGITTAGS
jgi:DNA-binding CsgD family transcriptional regulator